MKRLTIAILPLIVCFLSALAAGSNDILSKSAAKIAEAPSLYVTYTVTADGHKAEGQLVVQGEMFTLSTPGMRSWYDGKTQWTYSSQMGEVNIITPTADELRQINPLTILKSFSKDYNSTTLKSATGFTTIRLKAKKTGADIISADITINDKTRYPSRIVLTMSNNQKVTIDINSITTGKKIPAENFRFDKSRFPGINVVDLR